MVQVESWEYHLAHPAYMGVLQGTPVQVALDSPLAEQADASSGLSLGCRVHTTVKWAVAPSESCLDNPIESKFAFRYLTSQGQGFALPELVAQ